MTRFDLAFMQGAREWTECVEVTTLRRARMMAGIRLKELGEPVSVSILSDDGEALGVLHLIDGVIIWDPAD